MNSPTSTLDVSRNDQAALGTVAMEHEGILSDYDAMISHLNRPGISSTDLSSTFLPPHAHSPLTINSTITVDGEARTDGKIQLLDMINYYGIAPWDPDILSQHRTAIKTIKEKRARHSLQLDGGIDIVALYRSPTRSDRSALKKIKSTRPNDSTTLKDIVAQLTTRDMVDIVNRFLPQTETSLLSYLANNTSPPLQTDQFSLTPMIVLEKILRSPEAQRLGNALLKGLNWYGGQPDENASPAVSIKLISKAIRLQADAAKSSMPNDIGGYAWYQQSNWGKSYQNIWAAFEQHLVDTNRASSPTEAILLARLYQPQFPSDFQICNIPSGLPYRSSMVWVNFAHGVSLADAIEPGLPQRMTFQQLVDFPIKLAMQATQKQLELIGLSRIPPTLEWAITNGIIPASADSDYSQEEVDRAINALDEQADALSNAILQLDADPPQRSAIAEREMEKYFKGSQVRINGEWRTVYGNPTPFMGDGRKLIEDFSHVRTGGLIKGPPLADKIYSFRDVYMSHRLTQKKSWHITMKDGIRKTSYTLCINADRTITTTATWLDGTTTRKPLPDTKELFRLEFDSYLKKTKTAYETVLKNLFASLPYDDRQAIEQGEVKIYTLRKSTDGVELRQETPAITLPLRLRMGFLLQITCNANTFYYECLPRAGTIRKRADVSSDMFNGQDCPADRARGLGKNHSTRDPDFIMRVGKEVPFDFQAHEQGSIPKDNATCEAIIDQFGENFPAPLRRLNSEYSPLAPQTYSRAAGIAQYIANNFFYYDEELLTAQARGDTEIEQKAARPHWTDKIKGFIPFWGSISDLLSGSPEKRVSAIFGLIFDVLSFALPLGKFVSGSVKLISTTVRSGIRTALPQFGKLSQKLLISSVQNMIPFYGLPTLALRLSGGLIRGLYAGVRILVRTSLNGIKNIVPRLNNYGIISGLPQVTHPGSWIPSSPTDRLATWRGLEDVPVRNIGSTTKPIHHLIDPFSAKPCGPVLKISENGLSIGPSLYPSVGKNSDDALFSIPEKIRVRDMPEVDGRTTVYLDDVAYRLDDGILRRANLIDDSEALKLVPCRIRGVIPETVCLNSFVGATAAPTPAMGSVDETKGYAPWFGDIHSVEEIWQNKKYITRDGGLYEVINNKPRRFHGDLRNMGFAEHTLVPRRNFTATIEFRKGIYARINIPGTYQGATDTQRVGAIMIPSFDETAVHIFTRVNTDKYYLATLPKGGSLSGPLVFNRLTSAQMAQGTLGNELLRVYTGSLHANNTTRIHGIEAVERAMRTMEAIAIPLGTTSNPAGNMRWLKVDTSPGEALMFDHSTRMIVTQLPVGATSWTRSKEASEVFRRKTVEIFDTLFLSPTIKPSTPNTALQIQDSMDKLQRLLPASERPANARNIAFAEVTTTTGHREIYVSVSGAQGSTTRLPLFRHLGASHVRIGKTTYINVDFDQIYPKTGLNVTPEGKILAVPLTIKDIGTYTPRQVTRPTSLDSESKLIGIIREKYPDSADIHSVDIATTMRPCESCSVVMKQFGHDGGTDALQVLWN